MTPFVLVFLAGFASVLVYLLFFKKSRVATLLGKWPGPRKFPILGNALELNVPAENLMELVSSIQKTYGDRVHLQLGHKHYVFIMNPKDIEKILSSSTHIDKSGEYDFIMPWLGSGLLTSQGQKWHNRRKMLTPAFHFKILDDFLDVFNEQATTLVQVLRTEFGNGEAFDIYPYITRCALDIICETAMNKKIEAQQERDSDYVKAIYRIGEIIQHRMLRPWLHPNVIWKFSPMGWEEKRLLKILHGFTEKVIAEKKAEYLLQMTHKKETTDFDTNQNEDIYMKKKNRVAFLDLLLTTQANGGTDSQVRPLTDLDIREETDTFMFEGHDTTAANVSWTIFLLGCNPQCQVKIREELDNIFGEDKERHVTTDDMRKMKYLECCIKESLRLYPSVPIIARSIKTDLELDEDTIIPGGSMAFISPYHLHRDPATFPDPEKFLPDRFFKENSMGRSPFAYVPFSAGPRNCIGQKFAIMEEKVMLANIFRNFQVEAAEDRNNLIVIPELIIRSKNGLHIKLIPRLT